MRIVGLQRSATLLAFLFAVGCLLLVVGVGATPAAGGEFDGAGSVAASQADALVVDGDGSGEYETIQAAVDDAADGDTIRVLDGTYAGFAVDKDVTITTTAARLEAPVVIRGDGAPTIEGFTIRPTDSDSVFGVSAADTGGDWVLRDVTVAISADVGRAVFAKGSTGDWRIESSILEDDVSARETAGDWEITNTTITTYITATDASGDWTIRDSVIHGKSTDSAPLDALNTTGAWVVENTVVLGDSGTFSPESVQTAASDGAWTIRGSYVANTIDAAATSGDWTVRETYIGPAGAGPENTAPSVQVAQTSGAWRIVDSTVEGAVVFQSRVQSIDGEPIDPETNRRGEVRRVYWGQPGGPWDNTGDRSYGTFAMQCEGAVTCTDPRDSPPAAVPDRSALRELGQSRTLVVGPDEEAAYETIQAAIDDANGGDTIEVRPGEYGGFEVNKDVTITTTGAVIRSDGTLQDIEIVDGAAPVIEGFTLRADAIRAPSGGVWTLRDVTGSGTSVTASNAGDWRIADSELGVVYATDTTGGWTITDSTVEQVWADGTTGDWHIAASRVGLSVFADGSTGDWTIRGSRLGPTANPGTVVLTAPDTEGDWTVADTEIIGTRATAIDTRRSTGNWRLVGSATSGKLDARDTDGDWRVESSAVARDRGGTSVLATGTRGAWSIDGSRLPGDVVALSAFPQGDATGNYWGQLGGPREGQCRGNVDCGRPLRSTPAAVPESVGETAGTAYGAPTALITADRRTDDDRVYVNAGETVTFDGSVSLPPDGEIESYNWRVDGDDAGTGERLTRTFNTPGRSLVTLTVDDGVATDSETVPVEVLDGDEELPAGDSDGLRAVPDIIAPVAALEAPVDSVPVGAEVRLSAAGSEALQSETLTYEWDLDGDGDPDRTTANPATAAAFEAPGEYTVSVTVVDAQGGTDTASVTLRVGAEEAFPEAAFDALPNEDGDVVAGVPITLDAGSSTTPADREVVAYEWDFGDGTTQRVDVRARLDPNAVGRSDAPVPPTTSHTYDEPGSYSVSLTVVDSEGLKARTTRTVEVEGSNSVQVTEAEWASKPGPMIAGLGLSNDYVATVTSDADIEDVVFEFPGGETVEADSSRGFTAENTWYVYDVPIDEVTRPGSNVVKVRATDENGRVGTGTFTVDVLDPPGWFAFAMGDDPTVKRSDRRQDRWVVQSDAPSFPGDELVGPDFQFDLPVSEISGDYSVGVGVEYGFEYVFADRLAEANGGGSVSLSTPTDGLDLDADVGVGFGGERTRGFSVDASGAARVTPDGSRVTFERGAVEFAISSSTTVPIGGVAVYVPKVDTTIGVANVDLTLSNEIAPGATLAVNDPRTALVLDEIRLRNDLGLKVTAGVGSSADPGIGRVGVEARGIVASEGSFVTEIYPDIGLSRATVELRAGVRACLGPCGTEWLLNDEYPLVTDEAGTARLLPPGAIGGDTGLWTGLAVGGTAPPTPFRAGLASSPVRVAQATPQNATTVTRLTDNDAADRPPAVAFDDEPTAVWAGRDSEKAELDGFELYTATRTDSGWGERTALTDDDRLDIRPAIDAAAGTRLVAWSRESDQGGFGIRAARLVDGELGEPLVLAAGGEALHLDTTVAGADDGRFVVGWFVDEDGDLTTTDDHAVRYALVDGLTLEVLDTGEFEDSSLVDAAAGADLGLAVGRSPGTVERVRVSEDSRETVASFDAPGLRDVAAGPEVTAWVAGDDVGVAADGEQRTIAGNASAIRDLTVVGGDRPVLAYHARFPDQQRAEPAYQVPRTDGWSDARVVPFAEGFATTDLAAGVSGDELLALAAGVADPTGTAELFAISRTLAPDLRATATATGPGTEPGTATTVEYTVENVGDSPAPATVVVLRNRTGPIDAATVSELGVGEQVTGTFEASLGPTGEFLIAADPDGTVPERSTANNDALVVVARPDLVVSGVAEHLDGETLGLQVSVENRGSVPVGEFAVAVTAGGETATGSLPGLGANRSARVPLELNASAIDPSSLATVTVDPDARIREGRTANNDRSIRLRQPDLGVLGPITVNDTRVEFRLRNGDTGPTTATVTVFTPDQRASRTVEVPAARNANDTVVLPVAVDLTRAPDPDNVSVRAEAATLDADPTDNIRGSIPGGLPRPTADLSLSIDGPVDGATVEADEPVPVTVRLANDGDARARETLLVEGSETVERAVEVPPEGETELTIEVPAPEPGSRLELTATAGNASAAVTVEAATAADDSDSGPSDGGAGDGEPTSGVSDDGFAPGFGLVSALVALLTVTLVVLASRYRFRQ